MFYLRILLLACLVLAACTPKHVPTTENVEIITQRPATLRAPSHIPSIAYVTARAGERALPDVTTALEQALQAQGYTIVKNPSEAGYIIHVSVPFVGTTTPSNAQALVSAGHGSAVTAPSAPDEEQRAALLLADVVVAARTIAKQVRKNPKVVSTASKNTKVDHISVRLGAMVQGYDIASVRPQLVTRLAQNIAQAMRKTQP